MNPPTPVVTAFSPGYRRNQSSLMRGKIFTRDEADRMIPLVRRIVVSARARHRLILRKQDEVLALGTGQGHGAARERTLQQTRRLREELKACILELEGLGCFLRDAETGVVECYGEFAGNVVYFTWFPGHDAFQGWHPLDQSYVNRQPLPGVDMPKAREAAE